MTGGTEESFLSVLTVFHRDASERLQILRDSLKEEGLKTFIINIHALKGASAAVCAQSISEDAAKLETSGRTGDINYINSNIEQFIDKLKKLIEGINYALNVKKTESEKPSDNTLKSAETKANVIKLLLKLDEALKSQKANLIDQLLNELLKQPLDEATKESVDKISDEILMTEFDKAINTIAHIMTKMN